MQFKPKKKYIQISINVSLAPFLPLESPCSWPTVVNSTGPDNKMPRRILFVNNYWPHLSNWSNRPRRFPIPDQIHANTPQSHSKWSRLICSLPAPLRGVYFEAVRHCPSIRSIAECPGSTECHLVWSCDIRRISEHSKKKWLKILDLGCTFIWLTLKIVTWNPLMKQNSIKIRFIIFDGTVLLCNLLKLKTQMKHDGNAVHWNDSAQMTQVVRAIQNSNVVIALVGNVLFFFYQFLMAFE